MNLDNRLAQILTHVEPHRDNCLAALGCRVGVTHTGYFSHYPFQRLGHQRGDLLCRGARILNENIHHGDGNLRVFLPGREEQPHQAGKQGRDQQHRCDRGGDEKACRPAGNTERTMFSWCGKVVSFFSHALPPVYALCQYHPRVLKLAGTVFIFFP